jgi:glyoxylase-like metal-dependent hydrolase (beta-lactamase superfamily II)
MHKLAAGLWQLSGFPKHMINVYLAEDVLIDTATRWARGRILGQIKNRPLRLVALTHCHPDHQGSAKVVCEQYGVDLASAWAFVPGQAQLIPSGACFAMATTWPASASSTLRAIRQATSSSSENRIASSSRGMCWPTFTS